jgi:hypothetical protein
MEIAQTVLHDTQRALPLDSAFPFENQSKLVKPLQMSGTP